MSNVSPIRRDACAYWAERITAAYSDSVAAIIRTGAELIAAKADPEIGRHGNWGTLTGETTGKPMLPFGPRSAQCFMAIAAHRWVSNPNHGSDLPASWRTLYEMTKLSAGECDAYRAAGRIHPDMQRADAVALVAEAKAPPRPVSTPAPASQSPLPFGPLATGRMADPPAEHRPVVGRSLWEGGGVEGRPDLGFVCLFGADNLREALAKEGSTPADIGWDGTEVGRDWVPPPPRSEPSVAASQPQGISLSGTPEHIGDRLIMLTGADKAEAIARHVLRRVLAETSDE